jgi:hypothetical protein
MFGWTGFAENLHATLNKDSHICSLLLMKLLNVRVMFRGWVQKQALG